jgi:Zn-dependent protease/predicted transcriptional regulator
MQSGWRLGSLFGIPLYIDLSWFLVLALFGLRYGLNWQQQFPHWGMVTAYAVGLITVLLLFGSVLLHELGHSLVAMSQGIKVNSITLFLFGGIASIDQESRTPGKAFQVAIAGPAVSLALFILFGLLATVLPAHVGPLTELARELARINLVLVLFNLIPGLPLDGGQVLKAIVWKVTGSRFKGVHWAARAGKALGWLAIVLGLWLLFLVGSGAGLWIAFLGWFVLQNASSYDRMTALQEVLLQIKAAEVMTREFRVVDAAMSIREFADTYLLNGSRSLPYFAASDGRYRGMVMVDDLNYVERSQWESQNLLQIVRPLSEIATVEETTLLVEVIQKMETQQIRSVTVLSPAGAVAGIIDRGDVVQAIASRMGFTVPPATIQQIKQDGSYPPGFQLGTIAQATAEAAAPLGGRREGTKT